MKTLIKSGVMLLVFILLPSVLLAASASKQEVKEFTTQAGPDGIQKVEITAGSYFFDPNYIIVKVNMPVELLVTKESGFVPHNIVMHNPEAGIDFEENLSTTPTTITFTPTKTGKYPFYCSKRLLFFKSHRDKGMEGTLDVRD